MDNPLVKLTFFSKGDHDQGENIADNGGAKVFNLCQKICTGVCVQENQFPPRQLTGRTRNFQLMETNVSPDSTSLQTSCSG